MPDEAPLDWDLASEEEDDTYLMSNLFPPETGLPITVWVNVRGGARRDARVKVSPLHGRRTPLEGLVVVGVQPEPHVVHDALSKADFEAVSAWMRRNDEVIIDPWNGEADIFDLAPPPAAAVHLTTQPRVG